MGGRAGHVVTILPGGLRNIRHTLPPVTTTRMTMRKQILLMMKIQKVFLRQKLSISFQQHFGQMNQFNFSSYQ